MSVLRDQSLTGFMSMFHRLCVLAIMPAAVSSPHNVSYHFHQCQLLWAVRTMYPITSTNASCCEQSAQCILSLPHVLNVMNHMLNRLC